MHRSKTFSPFGRLPYELQDAVWEASLPCRLVNHNRPVPLSWLTLAAYKSAADARAPWPSPAPWLPDGASVAMPRGDRAIPAIAHVCRHARAVVLRHGCWIRGPADRASAPAWFDCRHDTMLIEDNAAMDWLCSLDDKPGHASFLGGLCRGAAGLAVAYALLRDPPRRRRLLRLLVDCYGPRRQELAGVGPLVFYADEIVLRGPRAAAAAAATNGLFHAPATARRLHCWRLVRLDDTAMLQRMLAFCEALARTNRRRRRRHRPSADDDPAPLSDDPSVAFFRKLLRPQHRRNTVNRIEALCLADRTAVVQLDQVPQFHPAVLVWFLADKHKCLREQ